MRLSVPGQWPHTELRDADALPRAAGGDHRCPPRPARCSPASALPPCLIRLLCASRPGCAHVTGRHSASSPTTLFRPIKTPAQARLATASPLPCHSVPATRLLQVGQLWWGTRTPCASELRASFVRSTYEMRTRDRDEPGIQPNKRPPAAARGSGSGANSALPCFAYPSANFLLICH